jgi:ferritin heavy chain
MALNAGMLLLQATILATIINPTEYSKAPKMSPRCEKRIADCGEFQTPRHDVGHYNCTFNKKSCDFHCAFACPGLSNGVALSLPNHRFGKEVYSCVNEHWKRRETPRAFCIAKIPVKEVKQNFHHIIEVNNLVRALLNTSYVYLAMASFYERADVALPGFSELMTQFWQSEVKHARDFMSYVNKRGGYIFLQDIPRPSSNEMLLVSPRPGLVGLEFALKVTSDVNDLALELHKLATGRKRFQDPHLKHILEDGIISQKFDTIKKLADMIRQLRNFADEDYDIGEYLIDLEIGKGQS